MFTTIWEFEVPSDRREKFLAVYGADGEWARLFRTAPGFHETVLLQDVGRPERLVTFDRWDSRTAWESFAAAQAAAYAALDLETSGLATAERHLGTVGE